MEDFAESVRNEAGTALPKDGTVAESTSNVIVFLEQLIEYTDTVSSVLNRNETDSSFGSKDNSHRALLGSYISIQLFLNNVVTIFIFSLRKYL